jgi:hypothetical protein
MAERSALSTGHPFPSGKFMVLIYVDPRYMLQLEGLGQLKNAMILLGSWPETFYLVAYCLNQLCYFMPP